MKKSILKGLGIVMASVLTIGFVSCSYNVDSEDETESTGLLEGAGTVVKPNLVIDNTICQKTGEVVVIPAGKQAVVNMTDDSAWNTYVTKGEDENALKGAFIKNRSVTLSPFVMSQYEVTQELYTVVMGSNPSEFSTGEIGDETQKLRPVECVSFYDAVAFCNELTKKTMKAADVVYFSDEAKKNAYTTTDAANNVTPYMDKSKNGYRLPTEAEWEYAARGGNPQSAEWKNAFGKVTPKDNAKIFDDGNCLEADDNLASVGWYSANSDNRTHEVGLKEKNNLNLYDMNGNVFEWCWDWYTFDLGTGKVSNPTGAASGTDRCGRGGSWNDLSFWCSVSARGHGTPEYPCNFLGIRVCRNAN